MSQPSTATKLYCALFHIRFPRAHTLFPPTHTSDIQRFCFKELSGKCPGTVLAIDIDCMATSATSVLLVERKPRSHHDGQCGRAGKEGQVKFLV